MISLLSQNDVTHSFSAMNHDLFFVKQAAQNEIYGVSCDLWRQPPGLLVSRVSQQLTLSGSLPCGNKSEWVDTVWELQAFLECMGGLVEGPANILSEIFSEDQLSVCPLFSAPTLEREPFLPLVQVPERLSPVYHLLCLCDSTFQKLPFDAWLSDFSYRCRHGFSQCFTIQENGDPVAAFSILFHWKDRAIGGALAVHPKYMGKGYGAMLLAYANHFCAKEGKHLSVVASGQMTGAYYTRRGWTLKGYGAIRLPST